MTDAEIKAYKFDRFKVDKLPSGWALLVGMRSRLLVGSQPVKRPLVKWAD